MNALIYSYFTKSCRLIRAKVSICKLQLPFNVNYKKEGIIGRQRHLPASVAPLENLKPVIEANLMLMKINVFVNVNWDKKVALEVMYANLDYKNTLESDHQFRAILMYKY